LAERLSAAPQQRKQMVAGRGFRTLAPGFPVGRVAFWKGECDCLGCRGGFWRDLARAAENMNASIEFKTSESVSGDEIVITANGGKTMRSRKRIAAQGVH
jgi:hypothetical protein